MASDGQEAESPLTHSSGSSKVVWYLAGTTGALTAALLPFLVVPWLPKRIFGALPYMHTPRKKLETLFELLPRHVSSTPAVAASAAGGPSTWSNRSSTRAQQQQQRHQQQRPKRFIDLGSGMGEAVIESWKRGYDARGIELNPTLFLLSSFNALRQAGPRAFFGQPRLAFSLGNMFSAKLDEFDVVMMFGVQSLMPRLTKKLQSECKDGAVVVLYRFRLDLPAADEGKGQTSGAGGDADASSTVPDDGESGAAGGAGGAVIRVEEAAEELTVYKVYRDNDKGK